MFIDTYTEYTTNDAYLGINTSSIRLTRTGTNDAGGFGFFNSTGSYTRMQECWTAFSNYDGIRLYNSSSPNLNDVESYSNDGFGLVLNGNTGNGTFTNCNGFNDNYTHGVWVLPTSLGHLFTSCEGTYNEYCDLIDSHYRVGSSRTSNMNTYYNCTFGTICQ